MTPRTRQQRWIEYRPLHSIIPAPVNPKGHALDELRASIERFGFIEPVIEDSRTGRLHAGHGRLETLAAAELAGLEPPEGIGRAGGRWTVPVVCGWSSANDDEAKAALVAVNRLVERGGWNVPDLSKMLDELRAGPGLAGTGYTAPDLDAMLASLAPPPVTPPEPVTPPVRRRKPRTKPNDVWLLGPHRLICGDCRDPQTVATALDGRRITMGFTSPPYAEQREYDGSSGFRPIPPDEYVEWFHDVALVVADNLTDDGSWFVNIKEAAADGRRQRYVLDLFVAHFDWGWNYVDQFVWPRPAFPIDPHNARRFKNGFEPVIHFTRCDVHKFRPDTVMMPSDHSFTYDPENKMQGNKSTGFLGVGRDGKVPGMAYPSNVLPSFGVAATGTDHPAAYPVGLPAWFVRAFTDEGDVVFDPFCGSGSTLLAAHQFGRVGVGVELSPGYVDQACERWQIETGIVPILERTGKAVTFV